MNPARFASSFAVFALLAGCGRHESPESSASLPPVRVRVATVRVEEMPGLIEVTGTVRPVQRAQLAAKVMGAIADLPVSLGQRVKAGDLLVQISAGEISARVLQAQAQLNQARRDLDRERDLLAKNASTPDMVKGLEDRFAMAEAMEREAEVMLGYATVRAPFDGVVARKLASAGDLAAPGQPLLELEGTSEFQVEAGIPDSLAARLAPGAELAVAVPATGATFTGALVEVSSAADPATRTVTVKLAVPAGTPVGSGQYARVQVPGAPVRALLAPAAAVATLGQLERVFVVNDHRAVLRFVKSGATRGAAGQQDVEILAGLADGDQIVVSPPAGLQEGQPLEIAP
ncbi:MAG TPA: efflux RND transporter periplasmic adaptor subunit [Opitutaceae bacterium]|nr:efflux RND transporter periplasmic adaptor subunit [Opitutaceae bacterium]